MGAVLASALPLAAQTVVTNSDQQQITGGPVPGVHGNEAPVGTTEPGLPRYNQAILAVVRRMPHGGEYSVSSAASERLRASHSTSEGRILVRPELAIPSYCSGATYLVLLQTLGALQQRGEIALDPEAVAALQVTQSPDGVGVWGRWNANGPGTARLFHELGAGRSFTALGSARAGDFLKIFWRDAVGKNERGHLVVFLGAEAREGKPGIRFWSSNKPGGYGEKWVPLSSVARVLFSRLENPRQFANVTKLPRKDAYLSQMLTRDSSFEEALRMSGVK